MGIVTHILDTNVRVFDSAALSLRCFSSPSDLTNTGPGVILGSADGSVAAYSLSLLMSRGTDQLGNNTTAHLSPSTATELSPSDPWFRSQLHNAGVNDIALNSVWKSKSIQEELLMATAGDDQRIALTIIGFERANSGQTCLQMLSCRHFDN